MEFHPSNNKKRIKKLSSNTLTSNHYKSKKLSYLHSDKNEVQNDNLDFNKETLNLFNGVVKFTKIDHKKQDKTHIIKSNSISNKNLFYFTDLLYNNEEHLNNDQIHILKNSEYNPSPKEILSPIKTIPLKLSINEKSNVFRSSKIILNFSKEKATDKKSLFKKNSYNYSSFGLKGKSNKNLVSKNQIGGSPHKSHKFHQNYSFFFKLKEKEKIPSKTPYLDKKFWKSSYDVTKFYDDYKENNKDNFKNQNSGVSLFEQKQSKNNDINHNNENNNKNEKILNKKDSIKKLFSINNKDVNEIINKNVTIIDKNETIKIDNNIKKKDTNIYSQNKKDKNSNNIIMNIFHKPFFCCLKTK